MVTFLTAFSQLAAVSELPSVALLRLAIITNFSHFHFGEVAALSCGLLILLG